MKKILIVHNFYRNYGGEDSNIYEEINFLNRDTLVYTGVEKISKKSYLKVILCK